MHWLSFVLGALAGWIVEWLIDVFYWRRRWTVSRDTESRLRSELSAANAELARLRAAVSEGERLKADVNRAARELDALRGEATNLPRVRGELEVAMARSASLESDLTAVRARTASLENDLSAVRARSTALQADLSTAQARIDELAGELSDCRSQSVDFTDQATGEPGSEKTTRLDEEIAIGGDAEISSAPAFAVDSIRDDTAGAASAGDDLELIEGIGPAIARILHERGIGTFAALAQTPLAALQSFLADAGPRFRVADPRSWSEQARLAAEGDREGLKALQANLRGGRTTRE